MRLLSMIRINEQGGQVPSEQLMHDMGKLIDEMTREGVLVRTAGLRPTAEGTRVRLRRGQLSTVDGPFTETKEVIGGFAILEAESMRKGVELTKRFLRGHGDEWDIECEVRQLDGAEFGREVLALTGTSRGRSLATRRQSSSLSARLESAGLERNC